MLSVDGRGLPRPEIWELETKKAIFGFSTIGRRLDLNTVRRTSHQEHVWVQGT